MADVTHLIDPGEGGAQDYASLNAWQAAIDAAYGAGDNCTAECYSSDGTADTTAVTFGGEGIDEINITQTDFPADGIYDATKYRLEGGDIFTINDACTLNIDKFQIHMNGSTYADYGIQTDSYTGTITLDFQRLVIKGNPGSNDHRAIYFNRTGGSPSVSVKFSTIEGFTGTGSSALYIYGWSGNPAYTIYQCVIEGNTNGINIIDIGASCTIRNCAVFNNSNDFLGAQLGSADIDYIASDDDDSWTHWIDLNENGGGEWAANFTDYSNDDYSIKDTNADIYHAGVNLGLSTDIIETSWNNPPSVGAFEYVSGGGIAATNLLDGKIIIKNAATNLLDGKTVLKSAATGLLDGKVAVKDMATNLLDGKAVIKTDAVNLLDGEVIIRDIATALLDGRISIQDVATDLLDGKIKIGNLATGLLDGKVIIKDIATDLLDGLIVIGSNATNLLDGSLIISRQSTSLLDGKITIKDVATGLLDGSITIKTDAMQLLDGKVAVQNIAIGLLDGSLTVIDAATCLLDGKVVISADSAVNLLDGKIILQASVGMMEITLSASGPVITVTGSGPIINVTGSVPDIDCETEE